MPTPREELAVLQAIRRLPSHLIHDLDPAQPPAKLALFLRHAATREELQWVLIETLHRLEHGPADPDAPDRGRAGRGVDHA